jgi:hypothetical protein
MTRNEFAVLCEAYCVTPSLALENERIVQALRDRVSIGEMEKIFLEEM